jgi:hypothetical protein
MFIAFSRMLMASSGFFEAINSRACSVSLNEATARGADFSGCVGLGTVDRGSGVGTGGVTGSSGSFVGSVFSGLGAAGWGSVVGFGGVTGSCAGLLYMTGFGCRIEHPKLNSIIPINIKKTGLMFVDKIFYLLINIFYRVLNLMN